MEPISAWGNGNTREQLEQVGLISDAQAGNEGAFSALIEPHLGRMYRAAVKITQNHEDAEDVCQESILKAFLHIRSFRGQAQFSTWLTRIVMNEALMALRKRQAEARYRFDEADVSDVPLLLGRRDQSTACDPEALCARLERHRLLWQAIERLEARSRMAILLFGIEEKETREIAKGSNLSNSGIKSRVQRAKRELREQLAPQIFRRAEQVQASTLNQ